VGNLNYLETAMSDSDAILMIFFLIIVITLLLMPPGPGTPLNVKVR
jgi:hypothetical protein